MSTYGPLAQWYDALTHDVPYEAFADYFEKLFDETGKKPEIVLDLACGTGTLTWMMSKRGYDMIGVDSSDEMLAEAMDKTQEHTDCPAPLFLCQELSELDLYGTVDAAVCSLDGMNYIPPEELPEIFRLLAMFVVPGGMLAFDLITPERLRSLDGESFVDENEDVLCLWRAEFDEEEQLLFYGMDLFQRQGELWSRSMEEHIEYAHDPADLCEMLREAGFENVEIRTDGPKNDEGRIFITAKNGDKYYG